MNFATAVPGGVEVWLIVIPRSSASEIIGEHDGRLKIRLTASPVEGAANKELIKLISKSLGVPKRRINLVSGRNSRKKRILIAGTTIPEVARKLK